MGLNNISFIKGKGGLGRPLAGKDHISGLLFYTNTLPSGFNSSNRVKQVFSVEEAEALGINSNYSDETRATGVYTVSAIGANGDTVNVSIAEPFKTVDLGTYVKTATETTVTLVAAAIVAMINANTLVHGYSAVNTAGAITITFRKGLGVFPNTGTPLVVTIFGTLAGSITTAVAGGVASLQAIYHYHISEYFRLQPKGNLFLGFYAVPVGTYTFEEIETLQTDALVNGAIRQIGVYAENLTFATSQLTALQSVANSLDALKMPLSVIYGCNIATGTAITSLADLNGINASKVSMVISQDNGALGRDLYKATAKSITNLGSVLGAVSFANVQEDIAWVGKFNFTNGIELENVGFCNGESGLSQNTLGGINDKRYIFLRKFPNLAGTFVNDSHTAVSVANDYAYIENSRVIDKAIRGVDESLLPSLNSPLLLNSDGTLANSTIVYLESQATVITDNMVRNNEASAISVSIDPMQNVASTSQVVVTINIVPIGVARNIIVNIGFKTSI